MSKILAFIHIKKTGGISLQQVLAKQFGKKFFGGHTHSELANAAANPIKEGSLDRLSDGSCICKHWTYVQYAEIHGRANFITVLRDPVDRIISHYNFMRMHYPRGESFREYIQDTKNINIYSRFLPSDLSNLAEVYIFENLQNSLDQSKLIRPCKIAHVNKTPYRHKVQDKEIEMFKKLNEIDLEIYAKFKLDNSEPAKGRAEENHER